jgi:membrane protein implicated in regulation of membrane protease activity
MKGSSFRFVARALLLVAAVGAALVCFGVSVLPIQPALLVAGAFFVVAVVLIAAVAYVIDEVMQKQSERIRTLEQALAQQQSGQA